MNSSSLVRRKSKKPAPHKPREEDAEKVKTHAAQDVFSSSNIGTWSLDIKSDEVVANSVTASLFGVERTHDKEALRLGCYEAGIHPEDRGRYRELIELSMREGGFFAAEYRTVPRPGVVRWVLAGGTFTADATGKVTRGAGILFDITPMRRTQPSKDRFFSRPPDMLSAINVVANRALNLWESVQLLQDDKYERIKPLLEVLMFEIGTQLAEAMGEEFGPKLN